MNKTELFSTLDSSRTALLTLIDDLTDLELIEPGVFDDWSVKDVLAHLAAWEAELVKLLAQLRTNKRPAYFDLGNVDDLNAKWFKENKNRPLDRVMADYVGVRKQTLKQLETFNDKELNDPKHYKWFEGRPLVNWVAAETYEHEAEHLEHIRTWKENREDN